MNRYESYENSIDEQLIEAGQQIEVWSDSGDWTRAIVKKVSDNKLIINNCNNGKSFHKVIEKSSKNWRILRSVSYSDVNNDENKYKIGDIVLAKWQDENYYLAKIIDIEIKTRFGTKAKHFKILYLYDNIKDVVLESRIKPATNKEVESLDTKMQQDTMHKKSFRRSNLKRKAISMVTEESLSDNVFYDEKTKLFTENCRLRRKRLSLDCDNKVEKEKTEEPLTVTFENIPVKIEKKEIPKRRQYKFPKSKIIHQQRFSQRKRKCCYKNSDYLYPQSFDQIFTERNSEDQLDEKTTSEETSLTDLTKLESTVKNPKFLISPESDNNNNNKETEVGSLNSPDIVSFASDVTPSKKNTYDSDNTDENSEEKINDQFSPTDDGKFRCNKCHNKTFRKKQIVLDHIKHYHQLNQNETTPKVTPKPKLFTKKYISNYVSRTNRNGADYNRKTFKNIWKENGSNYRTYHHKTLKYKHYEKQANKLKSNNVINTSSGSVNGGHVLNLLNSTDNVGRQVQDGDIMQDLYVNTTTPSHKIVYCHRCRKCNEDVGMVQCKVCLCWSHRSCYGLPSINSNSNDKRSHKIDNNFWECDNCTGAVNITQTHLSSSVSAAVINSQKESYEAMLRDKWRFHSVQKYENSQIGSNTVNSIESPAQFRNLCEVQSILSVCTRVLDAITRNLDRMKLLKSENTGNLGTSSGAATTNDSNSQDDLDIFKSLYSNIDNGQMPKIDLFDPDSEEIMFKETTASLTRIGPSINTTATSAYHSSSSSLVLGPSLTSTIIPNTPSVIPASVADSNIRRNATFCNNTSSSSSSNITNSNNNNNNNICSEIDVALNSVSTQELYMQFNELNFTNSTPNKSVANLGANSVASISASSAPIQNLHPNNINSNAKLLNSSLDGILDCDIQRLDILPKAEFDALVEDLTNCDDTNTITSVAQLTNNKSTINDDEDFEIEDNTSVTKGGSQELLLDFMDVVNSTKTNTNGEVNCSSVATTTSNIPTDLLPFTKPSCLYSNTNSESILDLFIEKESHCSNIAHDEDILDVPQTDLKNCKLASTDLILSAQTNQIPFTKPYSSVASHSNRVSQVVNMSSSIAPTTNIDSGSNKSDSINQTLPSKNSRAHLYPECTDNPQLKWLIKKYISVEKIIQRVSSLLSDDESSSDDDQNISGSHRNNGNDVDGDLLRINKYLSSLLFVLHRNSTFSDTNNISRTSSSPTCTTTSYSHYYPTSYIQNNRS